MKETKCRGFEPAAFRRKNNVLRFANNKFFYVPTWQYLAAFIFFVNTLKNRTKACLKAVGFANLEKIKGEQNEKEKKRFYFG
jgi:hypothetical protein